MATDAPEYIGFIDGRLGERLYGWCWRVGDDHPVTLELLIDDRVTATFVADGERSDLAHLGDGTGRHAFLSPEVLNGVAPDAIIRVKVAGAGVELTHSGLRLADYRQSGSPAPAIAGLRLIPQGSEFVGIHSNALPQVHDVAALRAAAFARLTVEPPGTMRMPPCRVANRAQDDYRMAPSLAIVPDNRFPAALPFPEMTITTLENAYCQPFGPPILPERRNIITDFEDAFGRRPTPWFDHTGGDIYRPHVGIDLDHMQYDVDLAFYMDHSVSEHFGHLVVDCLPRMYAWDIIRQLYGDVKLIIANRRTPGEFQHRLLLAAGAAADDIIRFDWQIRCKRLLLSTPSLGVEQYASPTSARLWSFIRDRMARRDIALPDRIYLSRSGIPMRRLVNETEVERIFARFGFTIVHPERLSAEQQIALVSNALLVAGPSGSGMFNLAFQGRLRSAFVLARDDRLQLTEMLLSAGRSCDLWYHLGRDATRAAQPSDEGSWLIDPPRLESDVADWVAASMS